ncbi:MAG: hypothetical protein U5N53_28235 [Mycobacterium sp.]|nr:hypothetical protein [Mycobacterium sp.]
MPVTPIAFNSKSVRASGASGSLTVPIVIPAGAQDVVAIGGMYWLGEPDISAATFTASIGGDAMEEMDAQLWDNTDRLAMYGLSDPDAGVQDFVINYSGIAGGALRCLGAVVGIYSGVGGIDVPVPATVTSSVSNSVEVPSIGEAFRAVFLHGSRKKFSNYDQVKRAHLKMSDSEGALWWWDSAAGELIIGDAPGDATVTSTATQAVTDNWDAIGVNLAPAPVTFDIGTVKVGDPQVSVALSVYRVQEIDQARTWKITRKGGRPPSDWQRDPQSVYDYTWDWSDILTGDDDIVNARFVSSSPGLELLSWNHTTTTATVWVRGPATADVTCHMVTDGGREDERTATIKAVPL